MERTQIYPRLRRASLFWGITIRKKWQLRYLTLQHIFSSLSFIPNRWSETQALSANRWSETQALSANSMYMLTTYHKAGHYIGRGSSIVSISATIDILAIHCQWGVQVIDPPENLHHLVHRNHFDSSQSMRLPFHWSYMHFHGITIMLV